MQLSVIIVNYNVKYFLEQALLSVRRAAEGLAVEVFVVDNNSADDSVAMVTTQFPDIQLIENKINTGFSVANNQAMRLARGRYVLLLNPDTVVAEDTFRKCIEFMDARPDAGGLGVRMIDGSGTYLPESKRGFPSPFVAFCKTFGLSSIFPKSAFFNQYHLGHLHEMDTNPIDVLAGAFMLMRREALEKVGLLDEAFFMYGEDIDLSYRIVKGGYKNYYFPQTSIIHYKGESTKRGSLNYVKTFYQAMIIFAQKHFTGTQGRLFVAMLQVAIYIRAILTLLHNWWSALAAPLFDGFLIFVGMYFLKDFWAVTNFKDLHYFPSYALTLSFPLYIIIWLLGLYVYGAYDRKNNISAVLRGLAVSSVLLFAIYGLLPQALRFSRMLLLLGAVWAFIVTIGVRMLRHFLKYRNFEFGEQPTQNSILVGYEKESQRVRQLMFESQLQQNFIGTVSPTVRADGFAYLSDISELRKIVNIYKIKQIIFCSRDVSTKQIIEHMSILGPDFDFKIVPEGSQSIIGSNSKNSNGELYTIDIRYNISTKIQHRNKRVLDIILSMVSIILLPLLLFRVKRKILFLKNIFFALSGQKTWVGYAAPTSQLPKLKSGILHCAHGLGYTEFDEATLYRLDFLYAKDYQPWRDVEIYLKSIWGRIC